MAKTGKLLGIMAVFGALIGGGAASTSIQAQAQTLPAMKISKLNYQSTSKNLSFTAKTSADVSKIAVEYKGKTTYFKAKKAGTSVTYKFTGYRNFKVYGTTSKKVRSTKAATITNKQYGTVDPLDYNETHTTAGYTLNVYALAANRTVRLYSGNTRLAKSTTNSKHCAAFTLSLTKYLKYGKNLTYTLQAKNRKTSGAKAVTYMPHASDLAFSAVE
ncbi:hypothetical protein [Secundilactobacillus collinoides]|uniref:Uncharacterized protein n=2 Tax=Secundilactobacillus collinoides TaxID=33960 RepID=A0A0R2B2L1_SECCO|nr:hypothetical protein [Secundilactobacillus collinoides]KRM73306.1 hypothetical protein FC82_GL001499 [Secundilactobacillus collinoides DSM 20515 = JCM 1123]KZL42565.1 hypothetical protein TY91_04735 [Secundilactobacillus collinoides]